MADLDTQSFCPQCKFRPKDEMGVKNASLTYYEEQLQNMLESWTKHLLNNFKDIEVQANIGLLEQEQQALVKELLHKGEFSLPIDNKLIEVIKLLLQGIEKVEIKWDDLKVMMGNGSPMSVEDVRLRFEELLKKKVGTYQTSRVRIMLEH